MVSDINDALCLKDAEAFGLVFIDGEINNFHRCT
jgi:hypothetical protein